MRQSYNEPCRLCPRSQPALLTRTSPGLTFHTAKPTRSLPSKPAAHPSLLPFRSNNNANNTYRAWLYVSGYQFGRYCSNPGPQSSFSVPKGILDYQWNNTVGLVVWAVTGRGRELGVPDFNLPACTHAGSRGEKPCLANGDPRVDG